jgi:hypothetical protein
MSQKETLRQQILDSLTACTSMEAFSASLAEQDISLYQRRGRLTGVILNGKKYRFRTLGLETALETSCNRWKQLPQRRRSLHDILAEKAHHLFREFGVPDRIKSILEGGERAGENPRLNAISRILRKKRQQRALHGQGRETF